MLRPQRPDPGRRRSRTTSGFAAVLERAALPEGQAGPAVDVHGRHRRDGLRDAPGAVPGARGPAVPPRRRGGRLAVRARRRSARSSARVELGLDRPGPPARTRDPVSVTVWGAAIAAFGLVGSNLGLALAFLAIAGGADVISAVFRNTVQQTHRARRSARSARRRSTSSSSPADRASATSKAGRSRACSRRRSPSCPADCCASSGVGVIAPAVPRFARWRVGDSAPD